MKITAEEIQNKFEKLPEDLKWAIMEANVDDKIKKIGDENGLNVRQLALLSFQIHSAMVGFLTIEKLNESIKSNLDCEDGKKAIVIASINERIFKDIREKIMQLYQRPVDNKDESLKQEPLKEKNEDIKIVREVKDEINKEVEKQKEILNSISSQKLTMSMSSPVVKTEYSLNNISKDGQKNSKIEPVKVDPYRMPVDK